MRKFKIIPIAHSLKGNKIAKCGDTVDESQLTSPASELIEAGFIKEITKSKKELKEEADLEKAAEKAEAEKVAAEKAEAEKGLKK